MIASHASLILDVKTLKLASLASRGQAKNMALLFQLSTSPGAAASVPFALPLLGRVVIPKPLPYAVRVVLLTLRSHWSWVSPSSERQARPVESVRVPVEGVRQMVLFEVVDGEVEEVLKRNWPSASCERGAGMMLGREMGEARRVKQVAVQLCVVDAGVRAGRVVVVRIVLVVVKREGMEDMKGLAEAEVVGAGDVDMIVLEEGIDGRLELGVLDRTLAVVNVEADSILEIEIEDVSAVTTEDEVGKVKEEPRV